MNNLKIGDKVVMNDKYHVRAENKGRVWTVVSDPWECCGTVVVIRHGRWDKYAVTRCIVDKTGSLIDREKRAYRCSECGRKSAIKENYCPNCGAKMDEEGKENARIS